MSEKSFYINNLLPRDDVQINNKNTLHDFGNDDFHYVVYYLELHKVKVIIRRLDKDTGWANNVILKIYDINNNKSELISIGSSNDNTKIINIFTNIELYPIYYNPQKIPKLIFQTTFSKNIKNILHYNSIQTFIELNPEYEYRIFDDTESREFIKNNFESNVLKAYDMLISGAFKAHIFRYCYLYINGGCYFDCKSILRKPLRDIISSNDDLILCKDIGLGYYNGIMMSIPQNNFILKCIYESVDNILKFNIKYDMNNPEFNNIDTILSLTGPILLYNIISNEEDLDIKNNINNIVKLHHKHNSNHYHIYMTLYIEYNGEYIITKQYHNYISNGTHYSELWINKKVIYSSIE
jgi:mannosyltransferase OCH1-like enzyme